MGLVPQFITLSTNLKNLFGFFPALINHFRYAQQAGVSFSVALKEIATSSALTQMALQGVVAAIGLAVTAFTMYKQSQEKAKQAAYDAETTALSQINIIKQQIDSLEDENQSREDLVKAIQAVDGAYKDEGQSIDELNKKRQESIDKLREEQKAQLESAKNTGWEQYLTDKGTLSGKGYVSGTTKTGTGITRNIVSGYQQQAKAYGIEFNADNLENYIASLYRLQNYAQTTGTRIKGLSDDISHAESIFKEATQGTSQYEQILNALNLKYNENTHSIEKMTDAEINEKEASEQNITQTQKTLDMFDKLGVSIDEVVDTLNDSDLEKLQELITSGDVDGAIALLQSYGFEIKEVAENTEEAQDAFSTFLSHVESMQSAYETLNKAANEYNKNGVISASTLKALSKLQPEYVAQLEVVNGKMQVGNGLLQEEFEYEKQLALISVETAKQLRIQALCQEYSNTETNKAKTAVTEAEPKVQELANALNKMGIEGMNAARGVIAVKESLADDEEKSAEFEKKLADIEDWANGMKDSINAVNLGAVESSKSAAGSHKDAWKEAFEEEQRLLKHSLEMNEITEIEYYNKLKDLNEKYFGEISGKHKQYLKEYQENEEEIYKGLKSVYDKVADYLQKSIEKGYENAINALKKEEKQVLAEIKAQIDELKREKQDVLDDINEQINGLKKKKDKVLNYWNAQIDKIKESNNHLQQQNELLEKQQALQQAKSQKVMVMKGGKFELSENESAVSQAEQALSQYQDQQSYEQQIAEMEKLRDAQVKNIEDRISALEEYKDYMDRYYDEEIDALEQYYDEVQRQYEAQIEALQEQLDAFKKAAEEQKEIEEARLAAQLLGIEKESDLFEMSLSNLSGYVEKYNSLVSQLQVPSAIMNGSIGHTIVGSVANTSTGGGGGVAHMTTRASGDSSFKNDEIALVGESPNAELVLGSHLNRSVNSGKLIHLSKGSGVVNAESTSTLAGLLNGIVSPTNVSNSRSTTQTFTFGNITLPNVTDGDSFVNTLSHKFNNYAIQYSSNRK